MLYANGHEHQMDITMLKTIPLMAAAIIATTCLALADDAAINTLTDQEKKDGWQLLFNGADLEGWKASERPGVFTVADGTLIVNGKRSHLFYTGPVSEANFVNFHFAADVKTFPKANSGLYFHTEYQEQGWPGKGYEFQVNNTHKDRKKTAGLYGIKDNFEAPVEDGEWFHYEIIVNGKDIESKINGKIITAYTEPEGTKGGRRLTSGTFAIQAHDPGSVVHYRNIKVKVLP